MILRYFLLLLLLIHPPAFAASRVALVIGNSGYEQNHDLDGNPLRDAETMAATLKKVGFSVTLKKDLSLSDMEDAVKSFGEQLDENTVALFYFSGHGVQRDGENYLIPLGAIRSIAAPGHLRDKTVNVNYVLSVMENAKSAVNLVFLDACRDNPFKGLFKGNATVGLATPKETPSGTLIAYATKAGGQSWTGEKGDNSLFVKVLAQEMAKPGVSIAEMLTQVRSGVMKATDGEQAPAYYNELNGTFCFVEPCGQLNQSTQINRYIAYSNGTVLDTATNLMWMRCALGEIWDGHTCKGELDQFTWKKWNKVARTKSDFAGYTDWRLPRVEELGTIVYCSSGKPNYFSSGADQENSGGNDIEDEGCGGEHKIPTLYQDVFPSSSGGEFMSSTRYNYEDFQFDNGKLVELINYVNFSLGSIGSHPIKDSDYYVRLVRMVSNQQGINSKSLSDVGTPEETTPVPKSGQSFRDKLKDGSLGPEMVQIPAGTFQMGSNDGESNEKPVHTVSVKSFALGKYEVTLEQYDKFCDATGRSKPGDQGWGRGKRPVINVNWNDAKAYTKWLSEQTGKDYRLPSEAQWEYACRAGSTGKFSFGNDVNQLGNYGWYDSNSGKMTHPVGEKQPNKFGLYDMHGNVWEWLEDKWHNNYFGSPSDESAWVSGDSNRHIIRGGSWYSDGIYLRCAYRFRNVSTDRGLALWGFRLSRM